MKPSDKLDAKWIGQRLREIMDDKGYVVRSLTDLANEISLKKRNENFGSYNLIQNIIKGKRGLSAGELCIIAECLGITSERFMRFDTEQDEETLWKLIKVSKLRANEILEIAYRIYSVSIGITERCESLYLLGRSQYYVHLYQEALDSLKEALTIAPSKEMTFKIYDQKALVYLAMNRLNDYYRILNEAEKHLTDNPYHLGRFYMHQAYNASVRMNYKLKDHFNILSYKELKKTKSDGLHEEINYSRALNNLGETRYVRNQYKSALILFLRAEKHIANDTLYLDYLIEKRIIQCYMALGRFDEAIKRIDDHYNNEIHADYIDDNTAASFLLLRSRLKKDQLSAQEVLNIEGLPDWLYRYAHGLILGIFLEGSDDKTSVFHYNKMIDYFDMKL